jgi:hypothetical protein
MTEQQADTKPPWYQKKRITFPSAVIGAFTVIMLTTGGNDSGLFRAVTNAAAPSAAGNVTVPPATAVMGESVREGRFSFVVTSVESPGRSITDRSGTAQKAQGIFVIVRVDVTNIGHTASTLTATDLYLVDDTGQRFATSSAIASMAGTERIFADKINPGQTVNSAPLLFDLAPGTVVASVELHDSRTSAGVRVRLS